jgi:hypothetical protein
MLNELERLSQPYFAAQTLLNRTDAELGSKARYPGLRHHVIYGDE